MEKVAFNCQKKLVSEKEFPLLYTMFVVYLVISPSLLIIIKVTSSIDQSRIHHFFVYSIGGKGNNS